MALRPVSELGLVDLTDLASPPAPATTKRRPVDPGAPKTSSRRSERTEGVPRAKSRRPASADALADAGTAVKPSAPARASRRNTSRAVAEKVGISVTCVVAGVAGVMLGRVAFQR